MGVDNKHGSDALFTRFYPLQLRLPLILSLPESRHLSERQRPSKTSSLAIQRSGGVKHLSQPRNAGDSFVPSFRAELEKRSAVEPVRKVVTASSTTLRAGHHKGNVPTHVQHDGSPRTRFVFTATSTIGTESVNARRGLKFHAHGRRGKNISTSLCQRQRSMKTQKATHTVCN